MMPYEGFLDCNRCQKLSPAEERYRSHVDLAVKRHRELMVVNSIHDRVDTITILLKVWQQGFAAAVLANFTICHNPFSLCAVTMMNYMKV